MITDKSESKLAQIETKKRNLNSIYSKLVTGISVTTCLYHLLYAFFHPFFAFNHRVIHWAFMCTMALIIYPFSFRKSAKRRPSIIDIVVITLNLGICLWLVFWSYEILLKAGSYEIMHVILGTILLIIVLEVGRRTLGWSIVAVAIFFLLYALMGPYLPELFAHKGYSLRRLVTYLSLTTEGIFTMPLGVSAQFICLFILYGAILEKSGAGKFFTDIAISATGWMRGGPAKAAIISSCFMGMISGSSVANVTTTGTFTIPLMKRTGYPPHFAGAVEASASTMGQIMPPIMGAGAFIMAEFLGVPYLQVCIFAIIPALLAFFAVFVQVHFKAVSLGIQGIPRNELPSMRMTFIQGWQHIISLIILVALLIFDYSPERAVVWAIFTAIGTSYLKKETRMSLSDIIDSFKRGATGTVEVAAACAIAGIISGTITMSGLGLKFSSLIMDLSMGSIYLALPLTAIACLMLGMGVPTTGAYIIISALAVPALLNLGIMPAAAHLFIFYYATRSDTTPPVALAAYAGAGIAGASPTKTGFTAFWLGMGGYLIPFMFVFGPELMLIGDFPNIIWAILTAVIGIILLSAGLQRYMLIKTNIMEILLFFGAAIMLIKPGIITDGIGLSFGAVGIFSQIIRRRNKLRMQAAGV